MARSLELPAIVGVKDVLAEIFEGQPLIMDGEKGDIIVEPIQDDVATYSAKRAQFLADKEELKINK